MSSQKTYFLCPVSDIIHSPPTGPLDLGSIIRSTSAPQYTLNRASVVAVTDAFPPIVETNWMKTVSAEKGLGFGIYAQFLQLACGGIPLGPELDIERSNKTANTFAFDTMTTLAFEPSQGYVAEAVKAPAVQAWLREPRQRFALISELFLVTGLKLVKGAQINYSTTQSTSVKANVGIDVPALGMAFGPKGHWTSTNEDATQSTRDSEFVFAFRVKRLRFGRRFKLQEYHKGAFMSLGGGQKEDDECVLIDDVSGAEIKTARTVTDATEDGSVYCVPA
ncbi:unnamed protein product [Zymoseptoria tritici ST99CH_1A5]|uniref:Uncharacterized protein n=3 Tax=Zymoseptoria tritici TaxID=1047171 RepID=F9XBG4_ZYMTI|nr:uncharacterized protein MYCGRDRAFT_93377 [Zymoseptoria tritici IPO323]EGP87507.1 hypothetical protein MYCGRDRAFT_93377 [Zymoseptoria tritici IPO323]SMQ51047.1 unnamed protein product [Zymoseptoria tritici ST99CH_3D7]SMR54446.1 unnamed protein product [Zymoseptoria tritici ST99CH_3D1]SMY24709.1 unnamed protein product [Zymoseptoria tritici ST99CH_1A5]